MRSSKVTQSIKCVNLAGARDSWEQLERASKIADPRISYSAFCLWTLHFRTEPSIRVLSQGPVDSPAILLALRESRLSKFGIPYRMLTSPHNYHWGKLCPLVSVNDEAVYDDFLQGIRRLTGWDVIEIGPYCADEPHIQHILTSAGKAGLAADRLTYGPDPYVDLTGTWDNYYAGRSRKLRANTNRHERRLEDAGEVKFEVCTGGADLNRKLAEFYRMEASGWKGQRGTAISSDPETQAFYTDLARLAEKEGWLRLYMLSVGDQYIAAEFCLSYRRTMLQLKIGYDSDWSRHSPGNVIRKRVLEHLFSNREADIFDMLPGSGDHTWTHKLDWLSDTREFVIIRLFNPSSLPAIILRFAKSVKTAMTSFRSWHNSRHERELAAAAPSCDQSCNQTGAVTRK